MATIQVNLSERSIQLINGWIDEKRKNAEDWYPNHPETPEFLEALENLENELGG